MFLYVVYRCFKWSHLKLKLKPAVILAENAQLAFKLKHTYTLELNRKGRWRKGDDNADTRELLLGGKVEQRQHGREQRDVKQLRKGEIN